VSGNHAKRKPILLDGDGLTIEQIARVARQSWPCALSPSARQAVEKSAQAVAAIVKSEEPVYGVNTGFGIFSNRSIKPKERSSLSHNLIRSHAVGLGDPFSDDVTRAAMLIRANSLAHGYSGIRPQIIDSLIQMINHGLVPLIPSQGSLGSSGDLAALAHLALVVSTAAEDQPEAVPQVNYRGQSMPAGEALQQAKIKRHQLGPKEGLALINGSTFSAALFSLACFDAQILIQTSLGSAALSLEALLAVPDAFDPRLHQARPHAGQVRAAAAIRQLTRGSQWIGSTQRVQDAYSLRCIPQVIGPVMDLLEFARHTARIEVNAATDNPLLFGQQAISGGNFHGQPVGLASDYLKIALSEVGAIAERRIYRLLDPKSNHGLPGMLVANPELEGIHSGLMMLQYTAASLVLENQSLATPDSIHSMPTSAGQEDHNANSTTSARRLAQVVAHVQGILAIECLVACQAIDLRLRAGRKLQLGEGTRQLYEAIRQETPFIEIDQPMKAYINRLTGAVANGSVAEIVAQELEVGD
jgi:histidine ammonia-lyase